ncbi:MAG: preprotein translocase subunit TatB [Cycloclasticus sp. symbiont of Bathymodiolus heckerae]|nr:MAG: preprotein translocase subunit TatB [Cycloclasticus sp. symbiont of Bathymodiolus heckerae]
MLDIGFFEICLVAIIALLVIGPEKLPRVARTTGLWLGKARGMVKTVKYEIDEQIRMEELKQSLEKVNSEIKEAAEPLKGDIIKTQDELNELTSNTTKDEP